MSHRILLSILTFPLMAAAATAAVPDGYYAGLAGKSGDALAAAVKSAATSGAYKTLTYNSGTWRAFASTDVRTWQGTEIWWDMYSNEIVPTDTHNGLNIEHCVANSWWGGVKSADPYKDLFNLNPSNEAANNQKGNVPLGVVAEASYDNGLVRVGKPAPGTCGGIDKVFEPADEYKGDFARAYLYVFAVHSDAPWKAADMYTLSGGKPVPAEWAAKLLLEWNAADPVDSKELARNEAVYAEQKNRNPFIDYPELADYLWGSRKGESYPGGATATAVDRPAAPGFEGMATAVNTYYARWWNATTVAVSAPEGDLWASIDGGEYQRYGGGITLPAATSAADTHTIRAYTEWERNGSVLRSPVSTLRLVARDPAADDYKEARWTPAADLSAIDAASFYVLLSSTNHHSMSWQAMQRTNSYLLDAGLVRHDGSDVVEILPETALVKFEATSGGKYLLRVLTPEGESRGFWNVASSGNSMTLADQGTAAALSFASDGAAVIDFGAKTLKYNKQQPRFSNYGSNNNTNADVLLYRFSNHTSAITDIDAERPAPGVAVDGNSIYAPEGSRVFDLSGRAVDSRDLRPGIYIVATPQGRAVKIVIR